MLQRRGSPCVRKWGDLWVKGNAKQNRSCQDVVGRLMNLGLLRCEYYVLNVQVHKSEVSPDMDFYRVS